MRLLFIQKTCLRFFPNILHSPSITIDIKHQNIIKSFIKEFFFFFLLFLALLHLYGFILAFKKFWAFYVICFCTDIRTLRFFPRFFWLLEHIKVWFGEWLVIDFDWFEKLIDSFGFCHGFGNTYQTVHGKVTDSGWSSMHIETVANFSIDSKTKIIAKCLLNLFTLNKAVLSILHFLEFAILNIKHFTSKISASTSQISKYYSFAWIHSFINFLRDL